MADLTLELTSQRGDPQLSSGSASSQQSVRPDSVSDFADHTISVMTVILSLDFIFFSHLKNAKSTCCSLDHKYPPKAHVLKDLVP